LLFDINPKENRRDLFDRERELSETYEALKLGERFIIVYGVRRIGKTSLLKVALNDSIYPFVIVDVRAIYYSENIVSAPVLVRYLLEGFKSHMRVYERVKFDLKEALKRIHKIRIGEFEIEIEPGARVPLTSVLSCINEWCRDHGMRFVFVFDEAQYLRFSNVRYDGVFAWAIDNLGNLTFILTGSEVGILRDFLRIEDAESPLFGRYRREIYVDRFSRDASISFLVQGFRELNIEPSMDEIEEIVNTFNGLVGWLTMYGYYRALRKLSHEEAKRKVFEEGSKLVLGELEKVIYPSRKRYVAILKAVASGLHRWSSIKAYLEAKAGPITDRSFTSLLKNLVRYGYLEKTNGEYRIPDPMVEYTVKKLL